MGEKVLVRAGGSSRQSPGANVETLAAPAASPQPDGPAGRDGAPLAPAPLGNGSIVAGKYLVEETLAEGGIGVVVVARHLALQQRVAIKFLKPKTLANPAVVERFVREARLAAQLTSEHVVRVFDVGSLPEAGPYMVMEYLVGEDLGRTLSGGPLPIARAIDYALQACDALAEAHALRIVHRDIKPENLFLAQRASGLPVLKIIDFGISKVAPKRGEVDHWGTETGGGERFGTPLYMSPEQLRATSSVDMRTDLWSLGAVLYEILTGALPFGGNDLPQICTSILTTTPVPIASLRAGVPPAIEAAVLKCLEKDPNRRFRNVAELAQALVPFGPPSAADRVERIVELIRRAGDSVRPPAPAAGATALRSLPAFTPPSLTTDARAVTTVNVRVGARAGRWAALVAASGAACAVGLVAVASRVMPTTSAANAAIPLAAQVAAAAIAPSPASAVAPRPEPAPAEPETPVGRPTGEVATARPAADAPAPAPSPPPAPRAKIVARPRAVAPPNATARPSPSATAGSIRRAQFGERE